MSENKNNILAPVNNEALEKVIQSLKEGNSPQKQHDLAKELKNARLLSPCSFEVVKEQNGRAKVRPDQIKFFLLNTNDGKTFFPVFTNFEMSKKIKLSNDSPKVIVRTIRDLGVMLNGKDQKAQGLIINPGADNIVIPKNLVLMLAGLLKQEQAQPQPQAPLRIVYGEPSVYPTRMVTSVYNACETLEGVNKVWLKQKTTGMQVSFVFIVDAEKQDPMILATISKACEGLSKGLQVEVIWCTEELKKKVIGDSVALFDKDLEF